MRLVQASATLLLAGAVGVSAWSHPPQLLPPPPAVQADPALAAAQARKAEIDIELAWLSDPAAFTCQLSAHQRGNLIELCGMVPNDVVRQRVISLAQQNSHLPIMDKLTVQPGCDLPVQPCNRDALCRTAVTRLAKAFGDQGLAFDVTADEKGRLTVAGVIASCQEKLDVSRRLSQLPGCTAVINKLEVQPRVKAGRTYAAVTADGQLVMPVRPVQPAPVQSVKNASPAPANRTMVLNRPTTAPVQTVQMPRENAPPATANRTMVPNRPPVQAAQAPRENAPPANANRAMVQLGRPTPDDTPPATANRIMVPNRPTTAPSQAPRENAPPATANRTMVPNRPPVQAAQAPRDNAPPATANRTMVPNRPPLQTAQAPRENAPPATANRTMVPNRPAAAAASLPVASVAKATAPVAAATKTATPGPVAQTLPAAAPATPTARPGLFRSLWTKTPPGETPSSPYAMSSKPQARSVGQAAGVAQQTNSKPQELPRPGQPAATVAGTPSSPRPQAPVAMAGTPSPGPRPTEERRFVPTRPDATAAVVPANHQQPAGAPRPAVLPTSHQEAPQAASRPTPRPLPEVVTAPAAPAQPRPLPPAIARPEAPPASPYANRPVASTQPTPAPAQKPVVQPASASQPAVPSTAQRSFQPTPPAPAMTAPKPAVQPASASQPAVAATAQRSFQPTPPAPRPAAMMPATAQVAPRTAPAPTRARFMEGPSERMSSRPTTPDITPGFMSHIRQRVLQISAGRAHDLQLQKVASDRLKISLKVNDPKEGEKLAAQILGITELGPFQVDLEVQLGDR